MRFFFCRKSENFRLGFVYLHQMGRGEFGQFAEKGYNLLHFV